MRIRRKLFACVSAMLTGIYVAYFIPDAIPITLLFGAIFVFFISLFFTKRGILPLFMILFFLFGAFHLTYKNDVTKRAVYPYLNEYVTLCGDVIAEPVYNENDGSSTVTVRLLELSFLESRTETREKLYVKIKAGEPVPGFGQRFTAVCVLYIPSDAMNRGGFDYALHLKSKNMFFRGTAEKGTMEIVGAFPLGISDRIYQLNRYCTKALDSVFPRDAATVLQAMCLGNKENMSEELEEALSVSGLSHMTSVSGMHVSTLVGALYVLFSFFKRNRNRYTWLTGGLLLFFMIFTGASAPVVRACIMGILMLLAPLLCRKADPITSLAFAAGVIVCINPLAAFDAGFMLSFAATLGIFVLGNPLRERLLQLLHLTDNEKWYAKIFSFIIAVFSLTAAAQLFLLPVAAWIFGYVSRWSFITSILTAPLATVLLICGLLVSFLGLLHPMLSIVSASFTYPFVKVFLGVTYFFGNMPQGLFTMGTFSFIGICVYGTCLFIFKRLLRGKFRQCIVVSVLLPILLCVFLFVSNAGGERAELTFINVGEGDCALLRLPSQVDILIDGGGTPSYRGDYDVGKQIVLPYLRKKGIYELDYVVATHPHEDHIRGLLSLFSAMRINTLLVPIGFDAVQTGAELLDCAKEHGVTVRMLQAGDILKFSRQCDLEVLLPDTEWLQKEPSENDASLVLRFHYGKLQALFTGDLEAAGEEELVSRYPGEQVTILKVGHHGSSSSTTAALLSWAKPEYAYIPCDERYYNHPAAETLKRLETAGTFVFRADEDKDVTFVLNPEGIQSIRKGGRDYDEN
ncbi:MAG: DNA internalization-related competence protein ComEC/Rec2 [Clostridia bacterium]|nr:DNA internalization-related competence protein ComEC/Rec2 [Clostridia bacterium]